MFNCKVHEVYKGNYSNSVPQAANKYLEKGHSHSQFLADTQIFLLQTGLKVLITKWRAFFFRNRVSGKLKSDM